MQASDQCVREFLQTVCKQIRFKGIHKDIVGELSDHIEDQKSEYIKQGFDEATAALKAVEQMGDPVSIGKQLDKAHQPKTEWSILSLALILVIIGGAVQFLLSRVNSYNSSVFSHFLFYAPIGIIVFICAYFFDYTVLGRYSKCVYFLLVGATLAGFMLFSRKNGAYKHVYYSALLFIPVFAAIIGGFRNKGYPGIIASGAFYAGAALLCLLAPTSSGFFLLTVSCLIILTVAIKKGFFGGDKKVGLTIVYVPVAVAAMLLFIRINNSPYDRQRLAVMLDPQSDPQGGGYQYLMVRRLVADLRPFGEAVLSGDLAGMRIDRFLPGWSTDFSLTYVMARLGYIPGLAIVVVMLILIVRMFISVLKQKNSYGFFVSLSVCLAITGQIIFYVISNLGIIMPFSVALPLISYGSTGFIVNMLLIGLLLSVYRRMNLVKEKMTNTVYARRRVFSIMDGKLIIDLGMIVSGNTKKEKDKLIQK